MGQLTVTGKVSLIGQPAATGNVALSGGTVETAKLGRVENGFAQKVKKSMRDSDIRTGSGSDRVGLGKIISRKNSGF